MDPDEALAQIRDLLANPNRPGALTDLAALVDGLDGWLSRGGFLPAAWVPPEPTEPVAAP